MTDVMTDLMTDHLTDHLTDRVNARGPAGSTMTRVAHGVARAGHAHG
jgi:hypothetical protein